MRRLALFAFITAGSMAYAAESPSQPSIEQALKHAHEAHLPALLDFSAVWCHSCYYMATHVLKGPQWLALEKKVSVIEIDADSPDGTAAMRKFDIKGLPTFVILNDAGVEVGRVLGDQTREQFYPNVERFLAASSSLDQLQQKAAVGSAADVAHVLATYRARIQAKEGLAWYASLPQLVREKVGADAGVAQALDMLTLQHADEGKESAAAIKTAQHLLAGEIGCDRFEVLDILITQSAKLDATQRKSLLSAQRPALNKLLDERIFTATPTCSDQRAAVVVSADLAEAIGDKAGEAAAYDRGIVDARRRLGDDFTQDRKLADDLRVFLMKARRDSELDALMPKLIAAYPDDYVYAYRFGHILLERHQPAQALPYLEQASERATGVNRLRVAIDRITALKALHRQVDADQVAAAVLKENGDWFPKQVEQLKAALKS